MRPLRLLALSIALAVWATPTTARAATAVKLATLVPERSVWGNVLRQMGDQWKRVTGGRVEMRIYPGGVAGDDPDIVRKMRIGQLHAGTLTVTGLSDIDRAFNVFGIPLFFESYEEYFFVVERLEAALKERLESNGFVFLHWGHGGWVHLFTTKPLRTVDDLRRLKLFVWAGNDRLVGWWKDHGYRPVPLALTDVVTALQTGMIEALPATPLAALSFQWFRSTPHMLELGFAPLIGATVMTRRGWEQLSAADQQAILEVSQQAAAGFRVEVPAQDAAAIAEMEQRGLTVERIDDPRALQDWHAAAAEFAANMRDTFVPPDIYDLALAARQEYRRRSAASL